MKTTDPNLEAFPPEISHDSHTPFFSLEDTKAWVKPDTVAWYQDYARSIVEDVTPDILAHVIDDTDINDLKDFRRFVQLSLSLSLCGFLTNSLIASSGCICVFAVLLHR